MHRMNRPIAGSEPPGTRAGQPESANALHESCNRAAKPDGTIVRPDAHPTGVGGFTARASP